MSYALRDVEKVKAPSVMGLVFFRTGENKNIGFIFWLKLLLFEIMFGEEMLNNLVMTASYSNSGVFELSSEIEDSGWKKQINYHIPNGIINNLFKCQITEMMYYKFYKQYLILETDDIEKPVKCGEVLDISNVEFKVSKDRLHQFMELKKLYNFIGATLNIIFDGLVYMCSKRLDFALLSGVLIEYFRKIVIRL